MAVVRQSTKERESIEIRDSYRDSRNCARENPCCSCRAAYGALRSKDYGAPQPVGQCALRRGHGPGSLKAFGIQAWNIQGAYGRYRNARRSEARDRSSSRETKTADAHRP